MKTDLAFEEVLGQLAFEPLQYLDAAFLCNLENVGENVNLDWKIVFVL
jgi:hypothetical protein